MSTPTSFWSDDPYVHSNIFNFREEVGSQINDNNKDWQYEINQAVQRLDSLSRALKTEADVFLQPWGDYKTASLDLFGDNSYDDLDGKDRYKSILNKIVNSMEFVNFLQSTIKQDGERTRQELTKILIEFGFDKKSIDQILKSSDILGETSNAIAETIQKINPKQKRINLEDQKVKQLVEKILNTEISQKYFQNKDSLAKKISKKISKIGQEADWNKAFIWVKDRFLKEAQQSSLELNEARLFIDNLKGDFIKYGKQFKGYDYSNISGGIGDYLSVSIINHSSFSVSVYSSADLDEKELVAFADKIVEKTNKKSKAQGADKQGVANKNQIKPMGSKGAKGQYSGTDWLIVNKNGKMVRAQVKNSVQIIEELRSTEGKTGAPQTLKVQDEVYYTTFKQNIQKFGHGKGGLSEQDWLFLDYLITNMLWFRSVGGVNQNKGSQYKSGLSGIQELVNRLLTKEINYFLGVTTLDPIDKAEAVEVVLGGSNVFFVIDNKVLYPTYLLIDAISQQLRDLERTIAALYVSFMSINAGSAESFYNEKLEIMKNTSSWKPGQPYGPEMLAKGKEKGQEILQQLKVRRGNLIVNIDEIMSDFFNNALRKNL